jgi:uncharacterized metal-binding protein YceD (DUF177 family)
MIAPYGAPMLRCPNGEQETGKPSGRVKKMSDSTAEFPWSVPLAVHDVPEAGLLRDLVADGSVRAATARLAGLRDLPRFEASFDVMHHGRGGLRVSGRLRATVGQTCVVTLEPIENEIDEPFELLFAPADAVPRGGLEPAADGDDGPEPLIDEAIDLGTIATEFLILAIDPYPRKPGAVFQPLAAGEPAAHPFAALAALKKGRGGEAD